MTARRDLPHWRERAACRDTAVDMVPDVRSKRAGARARAVCARCPVVARCLAAADAIVANGGAHPLGVWAGLDVNERLRRADGARVVRCRQCRRWCVPTLPAEGLCPPCEPAAPRTRNGVHAERRWAAAVPHVRRMLAAGLPFKDIAAQLEVSIRRVGDYARDHGFPSAGRRHVDRLQPCGTQAALRRHYRRKEPRDACACKHLGRPVRGVSAAGRVDRT